MNINELKEKLQNYDSQLEAAKASVYRLDGITQFLRFELEQAEKASADEQLASPAKSSEKSIKQVK